MLIEKNSEAALLPTKTESLMWQNDVLKTTRQDMM